jgi:hypothetical protein
MLRKTLLILSASAMCSTRAKTPRLSSPRPSPGLGGPPFYPGLGGFPFYPGFGGPPGLSRLDRPGFHGGDHGE